MNIKIYNIPFFENSVRVFFTLAALWAIFVPGYTVCVIVNDYFFPSHLFNIYQWHAYEMLYGFYFTLIVGFILTAAGRWSGVGPLSKKPLFYLFILWIIEKSSMLVVASNVLTIIASVSFLLYFLWQLNKLMSSYAKKWAFLFIISSLGSIKILYLMTMNEYISLKTNTLYELTIWLYVLLVSIIAGRVTPRFTKNFFKLKDDLEEPKLVRSLTLFFTALLFVNAFRFVPSSVKFLVTFAASLLHFARVMYWRPLLAIRKPTIGLLHIGYFLFATSIIYKAFSILIPRLDVYRASLHFILLGSVCFIAMNIMIRASLGHTGRKIHYNLYIYSIFLCIVIGTIIRVFVPVIRPDLFMQSLHHSMGFWTLAFILYLLRFFPYFLKKRLS